MSLQRRSLIALGAVGVIAIAVVGRAVAASADSDFGISCGTNFPGKANVVVVHVVATGRLQHGKLAVVTEPQAPAGASKKGPSEIDVRIRTIFGSPMCGAVEPGALEVRGTSEQLNGKTLVVTAVNAVRIEVRDSAGKLVTSGVVDPQAKKSVMLKW